MALVVTGVLAIVAGPPAFAAELPTVDQCEALAQQRGSGDTSGSRNHRQFMAQCLSGRIPFAEVPGVPTPVRDLRQWTYETCHTLALQRGASESSGSRNHERFISQCMAGRVGAALAARAEARGLRQQSSDACHALAVQRGSSDQAGRRTHEKFIQDCMVGKVP
jgi:hypothetical protein